MSSPSRHSLQTDRMPFGLGVGLGSSPRGTDDLDPLCFENFVEGRTGIGNRGRGTGSEWGSWPDLLVLGLGCGRLGASGGVGRTIGHATHRDLPRVPVDEEEQVQGLATDPRHGEQVAGDDRRGLGLYWRRVSRLSGGRRLIEKIRRMQIAEISAPTFRSSPWILM